LALVDRSIAAVIKANRLLRLPAFFLAKGVAFASGDLPKTLLAEEFLAKAMTHARQEAALPFELRAGLELARIWIGRGEALRAHDLISPVYNRFSEGFTTPDLIFARRILAQESALARQAG
jgi:predicted ATPase